jgi:hypothetical protein
VTVFSDSYIELLTYARNYLNKHMKPAFFETNATGLPKVLRQPNEEELREARAWLLDSEDRFLEPLLMTPGFYTLNEFQDLLFHPNVQGFNFLKIGEYLDKLNLKIVGFEFPGLQQEVVLSYRAEYPKDRFLQDFKSLQAFEDKYKIPFKNFFHTISFTCQKI